MPTPMDIDSFSWNRLNTWRDLLNQEQGLTVPSISNDRFFSDELEERLADLRSQQRPAEGIIVVAIYENGWPAADDYFYDYVDGCFGMPGRYSDRTRVTDFALMSYDDYCEYGEAREGFVLDTFEMFCDRMTEWFEDLITANRQQAVETERLRRERNLDASRRSDVWELAPLDDMPELEPIDGEMPVSSLHEW
jgi:hypothetical protein